MSIRIFRPVVFQVDGDGTATSVKINLKEHLESVVLAAALASDPQFGYALTVSLLFEGDV